MGVIRTVLFACFLAAIPYGVYSQNISMRYNHLSIDEGLSQSTITDILQDSKGFLWFATEDGLNRYDGYEFTVYKHQPGDSTSLSTNAISEMLEDSHGHIWVATKGGGLNRYHRETETFVRFTHDPDDPNSLSDNYITALYEDRTGVILVGTRNGLNIYQPGKRKFIRYQENEGLRGSWITSIIKDREDFIWIGTQKKGLNRFDRRRESFKNYRYIEGDTTALSDNWVETLFMDRNKVLWVGTQNGGLNRFDREKESFTHYKHDPGDSNSLNHNWVLTIYEDQYGEIWVGTMKGLSRLNREEGTFVDISRLKDAPLLDNRSITKLIEDRSGVFWVGTRNDGLYKFIQSADYFNVYRHDLNKPMSLSENTIWGILEANDGSLWIGTQGGGLNYLSPERDEVTYYRHDPDDPHSLSDNFVNTIYQDSEGVIWIGTTNGLNIYNSLVDGFKVYRHDPEADHSIPGNIITTIREDKTGKIWIGTLNNGLGRFDKRSGKFTNYRSRPDSETGMSQNKIWSFYEDYAGVFWVGTHGYGLNKYDRKNDQFRRFVHDPTDSTSISDNFVNVVYQDRAFRYWIGTLKGLNRYYPETESFKSYTTDDGLPNNVIYGIVEDDRGHLWLSTNKGITDFDPDSETFRNYDVEDGLPSNEFRFGAYHRGHSGRIYFGGIKGLVSFRPEKIRKNPYPPPVILTKFEIYNEEVPIGASSPLKRSIFETDRVKLDYRDKVISIAFAALHYASPSQNRYAYKLEGFDDEWQQIGNRRVVTFTNLPAKKYTLRVKAANKDGVWNEEGTSLELVITPAPWKTWWAYSIYGVMGIALLGGLIQFRIERERKKKKELEESNEILEKLVDNRTQELKKEKGKSEGLLYNILPREVATELKEKGTTTPRRFEEATIMFTDFKDFSAVAATLPAARLVNELNEIFQQFDAIIDRNGLEKIKTIGDAYMAAGGIPREQKNHALKCVQAAREILQYIEDRNNRSSINWEIRIGLHTGSVIAGVVGKRKFTYDLWGDTVILASKMEMA
ncbi:MAG: two-component regulator propeller domain-containing protein, partial [Balneolaceae bacterium]|nr:two-component regulator propeller domain-containing protein [Balneolaceae bacterium]